MSHFSLQAIVKGDTAQLAAAIHSSAASSGINPAAVRQQLATQIYQHIWHCIQLDTGLQPLFNQIESALIAQIAADDQFYCRADHPLRRLLDNTLPAASHWFPRDSKPSQQFYDKLAQLLQSATHSWHSGQTDSLEQALGDFSQWLGSEDKRASLLESRLCETELTNLKLGGAQLRVIETLNTHLAGRPLPIELHELLGTSLKSELQYWAFNTPPEALAQQPLWKHWQRILPVLGQVFALDKIQVDDQLLYSQIPALLTELERSLSQPTSNASAYSQLVEQLSHYLMAAVQKQPLDNQLFTALPLPDGQVSSSARVPLALLQATEKVRLGDWIIMRGDQGDPLRCKLALKHPALDQLLFVDHTGRKVMSKTNKDFALCLSTGIAQLLPAIDLASMLEQCLQGFIEQANLHSKAQLVQQKQQAEARVRALIAEQQAAAAAAEQAHQAEQARIQAELEARHAAARKAMAEARALADSQRRREAEQLAEQQRLDAEQQAAHAAAAQLRQQQALQTINELQVGAWLELRSPAGDDKPVRAKLSVIIGATGKYIFADQVGRKLAEYSREQLSSLLTSGDLSVLRNGDNFEDQLAKVIRGLRRDVN